MRVCGQERSWFATSRGTRQGHPISPTMFIVDLKRAMDKVKDGEEKISVHRIKKNNLRFANDINIIEKDENTLERTVHSLHKEAKRYGLVMNTDKTKTMVFGDKQIMSKICIDWIELENVEKFTYLRSNMSYDLDCSNEIAVRIAKAMANLKALDKIWKSKAITLETKLSILKICVFSTMLYVCETWTVTKRCESRILSFKKKCYRKILRIGWTQKVTNKKLYRKTQLAKTLLQKVIQRKLRLFGYIC